MLKKSPDGKWIECKLCDCRINTKHAFGTRKWKGQLQTSKHKINVGKGTPSILSFLVPREPSNVESNNTKLTAAGCLSLHCKSCPGIIDPEAYNQKTLNAMLLYGSFGDLNVSIMTKHNTTVVHVHSCSGKAVPE